MVPRFTLPIAVFVSALMLAPAAIAMPIRERVNMAPTPARSPAHDITVAHPVDFAWADALLGAGVAAALCGLLLAAVLMRRHHASIS